ncbi:MAG: GGDEF and EAL domain-containing protein [Lachnospiraceae bacterium]|nr:GGDEF and EAL domain-containing protein [Lachnospiraceae bacterium]
MDGAMNKEAKNSIKNNALKINNGFARFIMDDKLTILDINGAAAVQLNVNKTNLRAGKIGLAEILSDVSVKRIKEFGGSNYGNTLEFEDVIVSDVLSNGEEVAKTTECTYQMCVSRIHNDNNDGKDVYVIILTNLSDVSQYNEEYHKTLFELETINKTAIKASLYVVADEDFTLYEGGERYYSYLGYTEYEYQQIIENKSIRTIYPPDREKLISLFSNSPQEVNYDIRVIDKKVSLLWVNVVAKITDKTYNGHPVYFCIIKDISNAKTTLMELNKQKRFLELISTSLEGGTKICYNDKKFSFAYVGDELLNFLGYSYEEFMRECNGNMYDLIHEQDVEEVFEMINSWFISGNYYEVEYRIRKSDGSFAWVMDKGNKIIDENGNEVCVGLIVDVDNTRKIIGKLEESNSELKKLQNSIPGSFGKITLFEDEFVIRNGNEQLYELLGIDTDKNPFGVSVNYEKLGISMSYVNEVALRKEENVEYILHEEVLNRWYMVKATYSGEDYASRYPDYYVMVSDITQQKEAQFQIELQREKYKMIAEILEDIIFEYDVESDVMLFSDKYKQVFEEGPMIFSFKKNLDIENVYTDDSASFRGPKESNIDYLDVFESVANSKSGDNYSKEFFVNYKGVHGKWYCVTATGIWNDNSKLVKIIGALRDVDTLKKEQKKLFDKSRLDAMSGLLNKVSTQEEISKKISQGLVEGVSALIMIDIDDFKTINDVYGHLVGDKVIVAMAKVLKTSFREEDIIGRVGGDEFQVFMSGILDRQMVVERVISIIERVSKITGTIEEIQEGRVAISVGVAFTSDKENYNILYNKADSALYTAKRNGKNRYEIYGQASETKKDVNGKHKSKSEEVLFEKVVEMAFSEFDFRKRMALIFDYVGYHMELFSIELYKYNANFNNLILDMRWDLSGFKSYVEGEAENAFVDFTSGKEYAIVSEKNMLDYSFAQKILIESSGISGAYQYVIMEEDRRIGAVSFTYSDKERELTPKEITKLTGISKLIKLLVLNDVQSGHVINKEFRMSAAIKNECEFVLEVNPRTGEYDMYVSDANGVDENVSRGDYATMMSKAIAGRVDDKYKESFSRAFSIPNLLERFLAGERSVSMEIVRKLGGQDVWTRAVAIMPDLNVETGRIYIYYYKIDPVRIEQIEESRKNRADNKQQTLVEENFEEIYRVKIDEEFIYVTGGNSDKLKEVEFNSDYSVLIRSVSDYLIHPDEVDEFREVMKVENLWEALKTERVVKYLFRRLSKEDKYIWTEYCIAAIKDGTTNKDEFVIMTLALDNPVFYEQKEKEILDYNMINHREFAKFAKINSVDTLTGVYNIESFYDKTREMMDSAPDKKYAIIRVDIDKFKLINDLYGFSEGDKVLRFLASVIRSEMQDKGTYGRINSDIFCMCITYESISDIICNIEHLIERFDDHHMKFKFVPFFGIYMVDDITVDIGIMCDWANLALKTVKGNQISRYAFYDTRLRKNILDEKMFENEMEQALACGQFEAYIQPQYDIGSAAVISAEALIRWNHPTEGVMSPARFIPVFERNGFIIKVDEFIWEESCKTLRKIIDSGWSPVPISVNVSRLHMYDEHLCDKLIDLMNKYSLPHRLLVLEVTETVYFDDAELMNRILVKLRNSGFSIAMDDFGSGYSSFNMLQDMKIDELKIDREFLSKSTLTKEGKTIVKYIIAMAHDLKLKVVAEGVETAEQAAFLLESDCHIAQGYYYSRPVPTEKFIELAFNPKYQKKIDEEIERVKQQMEEGKVLDCGEETNS